MTVTVTPQVHAVLEHRKASSACCGKNLQLPAAGAEHEFECTGCGQPTERVFGAPKAVEAHG
jgi:hypothetical protein